MIKKLLGRNDIENALNKLDSLTKEESKMAIAEIWQDVKEVGSVVRQSANAADVERSSCSTLTSVDSWDLLILTESKLREKLKIWLSPPDPFKNHNNARKAHHGGTASWFFQGSNFKEWKSTASLLWVHGKRTTLFFSTPTCH
jgi:protein subunit release factor A